MKNIPKTIHQVYTKGFNALPAEIIASIRQLKTLNPGWDYQFYDEARITAWLSQHYGEEMLAIYLKINPKYGAARADFFRYLLIYVEGGVYLDIKSCCTRPLDEVIPEECKLLLCSWDNQSEGQDNNMGRHPELSFLKNGEYQQWNIIAAPGSPYIKAAIDLVVRRLKSYKPWINGIGMRGVLSTTGPIPFSLGIEQVKKCQHFYHEVNHRNIGLIYRNIDKATHRKFTRGHYSTLKDPIVTLEGNEKILYHLWLWCIYPFVRLKKNTLNEGRKAASKVKLLLGQTV